MAFKDGMNAIAGVLRFGAVGLAVLSVTVGAWDAMRSTYPNSSSSFFIGLFVGVLLFLALWTPAWIIKKFIQ